MDPARIVPCVIVPPKLVSTPAIVIPSFANSTFATPPFLIITAPLDTLKLSPWNEAIPLLDVVASSPDIVPLDAISIPSPAVNAATTPPEPDIAVDPAKIVA